MSILDEIKGKRLAVISSHYDDEALFAGGLMLRAEPKTLTVAILTDVAETNRHKDPAKEPARQLARLAAFASVREKIGFEEIRAECPNLKPDGSDDKERKAYVAKEHLSILSWIFDQMEFDIVITHGEAGEYGHSSHKAVHYAVRALWGGPLWCFAPPGFGEAVLIDLDAKMELLKFYDGPGHRSGFWKAEKAYPEFVTECEWFEKIQGE